MYYFLMSSSTLAFLFAQSTYVTAEYTLPQDSSNPVARSAAVDITQAGFEYGPPVAGGPAFPSGVLGVTRVAADVALLQFEVNPEIVLTADDSTVAAAGELSGKVQSLNLAQLLSSVAKHDN